MDKKSKLIMGNKVTDASVHDSQHLNDLLNKKNKEQPLYAASAYTGEEQEKVIKKAGMIKYDVPFSVLRAFKRKSFFQ